MGKFVVAELRESWRTAVVDIKSDDTCTDALIADVCEFEQIRDALCGGNVLVHLAGIDASLRSEPMDVYRVNTMGTWNVLQAAEELRYEKVIICSSVAVFGLDRSHERNKPQRLPVSNDDARLAYHAYGLSKIVAEELALAYSRRTGTDTICLRPAYVLYPELLRDILERACKNTPTFHPTVPALDRNRWAEALAEPLPMLRSYVLPEDLARAVCAATERDLPGYRTYILAARDVLGDEPAIRYVEAAYGRDSGIALSSIYEHVPDTGLYDTDKACKELGWQPRLSWRDFCSA